MIDVAIIAGNDVSAQVQLSLFTDCEDFTRRGEQDGA